MGSVSDPITYDAGGRLKTVPGLINDALYNARGAVTSLQRANAVTTTYGYSTPRGWLTDIDTSGTAGVVQDLSYTRGPTGRIDKIAGPTTTSESWTFGYDDLDRLLCANNWTGAPTSSTCTSTGGSAALRQTFTYSPIGNMLTNVYNGLTTTYTYPTSGANVVRPHTMTRIAGGSLGTQTFAYDANGSMTCMGTSATTPCTTGDTRSYDGENRLAGATDGATTTQFAYGPDGARLKKTANGSTTLYLGADIEIVGWAGAGTGTMHKYLPGDAKREASTTNWLHRDQLGSVRAITDLNGNPKLRVHYRPYGEQIDLQAPMVTESKGYIGERQDDETGLMYLNARYYDPLFARFIQADPSDPTRSSVGINRYAYAGNSPISNLDPSGLEMDAYAQAGLNAREAYLLYAGIPGFWEMLSLIPGALVGAPGPTGQITVGNPYAAGMTLGAACTRDAVRGCQQAADELNEASNDFLNGLQLAGLGGELSYLALSRVVASRFLIVVDEAALATAAGRLSSTGQFGKVMILNTIGRSGKYGEAALAEMGGESQVYYATTLGPRYIDQVVAAVGHESKVGYTALTGRISEEIAKDAELVNSYELQGVVWHFFPSAENLMYGTAYGPSAPLLQQLLASGINVVIY